MYQVSGHTAKGFWRRFTRRACRLQCNSSCHNELYNLPVYSSLAPLAISVAA